MNIDDIREALKNTPHDESPVHEFAVLIPLFEMEGELHVLFEVRSMNLKNQPGEICLPGGRLEPEESPEQTAVRETCEELGICSDRIEVLGAAETLVTPFRYALFPYVAYLKHFSFPEDVKLNPDEVAEVFSVPLQWLMENPPEEYQVTTRFEFPDDFPYHRIQNGRNYAWKSATYPIHFYQYGEYTIWGMTAKILEGVVKVVKGQ